MGFKKDAFSASCNLISCVSFIKAISQLTGQSQRHRSMGVPAGIYASVQTFRDQPCAAGSSQAPAPEILSGINFNLIPPLYTV